MFLMFSGTAENAMNHYISLFDESESLVFFVMERIKQEKRAPCYMLHFR
jgi:predicted 3-demethylubiquinone-9 3-methyltransferase (glyoxalase superfamily)